MKIPDPSLNPAAMSQLAGTQQVHSTPHGATKPGAAPGAMESDQVQLSDLSGRLVRMLSVDSPERAAWVEQLAAEFKAGNYRPDSAAVSRGIIAEAAGHGS